MPEEQRISGERRKDFAFFLFTYFHNNTEQNLKTNPGNHGITNEDQTKWRIRLCSSKDTNVYGEQYATSHFLSSKEM